MSWMRDRYRELQSLIGGRSVERDVADEINAHISMRTEENIAAGMSPEMARDEAMRRFGASRDIAREAKEIVHASHTAKRRWEFIADARRDLSRAIRALLRAPAFSATALIVLALGLGATMSVFTVLQAVVLRPLPYPDGNRLLWITHPTPKSEATRSLPLSSLGFQHFSENSTTLESIALYTTSERIGIARGRSDRISVASVSASVFAVLKMRATLGRTLLPQENRPLMPEVAVIGYHYWQKRFGGSTAVLGSTVEILNIPLRIVGVLEPGARLPESNVDVWTPYSNSRGETYHYFHAIGRMKESATVESVKQDLGRLTGQLVERHRDTYTNEFIASTGFTTDARSLREEIVGDLARAIWLVFALVLVVLVIACANVANLFIVRADTRRREAAIRIALGSGHRRLAWHFLTETLLLAIAAGVGGVVIGALGVRTFVALAPAHLPRLSEVDLDATGVAFTIGLSCVVGIGLGLLQTVRVAGALSTLREGGRSSTVSRRQQRVRNGLVVGQVALALVLLAAAGVMLRTISRLHDVQPGFDANNVVMVDLHSPAPAVETELLFVDIPRMLEGLPEVARAGLSHKVPIESSVNCNPLYFEDERAFAGKDNQADLRCIHRPMVSPGYFEALGISVTGHSPTWAETNAGTAGVVITSNLAARLWPDESPIGKGVRHWTGWSGWYRVVGVIDPLRSAGLHNPPVEAVYFPVKAMPGDMTPESWPAITLFVRTRGTDPMSVLPAIRRTVSQLNPMLVVSDPRTLDGVVGKSMAFVTFVTLLLGVSAAMGLLLSAVGLFGVIAYLITQRRPEIGVRMALGASDRRIVHMIMRQATLLAVGGVTLGLLAAIPVVRTMRSLVYGISPTDPVTLGLACLLLIAVAALAGYLPARRASRIQPVEALR